MVGVKVKSSQQATWIVQRLLQKTLVIFYVWLQYAEMSMTIELFGNRFQWKIVIALQILIKLDSKVHKMSFSDDKVVKTRLLLDGDGNGDDRRLNMLAKQVHFGRNCEYNLWSLNTRNWFANLFGRDDRWKWRLDIIFLPKTRWRIHWKACSSRLIIEQHDIFSQKITFKIYDERSWSGQQRRSQATQPTTTQSRKPPPTMKSSMRRSFPPSWV